MFSYRISGDDFDTVVLDSQFTPQAICTEQYYVSHGNITKHDSVKFHMCLVEGIISLYKIETDATDVVILPKSPIEQMLPNSLEGATFERFIISTGVKLRLLNKALYGSETVKEFRSLSRNLLYEGDVFPPTIQRRLV